MALIIHYIAVYPYGKLHPLMLVNYNSPSVNTAASVYCDNVDDCFPKLHLILLNDNVFK